MISHLRLSSQEERSDFLFLCCSDSYIVRVKAVVMTRDESSGGWLAQDGCLSRVGVCRLLPTELLGRNTFLIHGERLKDKQVSPEPRHAPSAPGLSSCRGRRHMTLTLETNTAYSVIIISNIT